MGWECVYLGCRKRAAPKDDDQLISLLQGGGRQSVGTDSTSRVQEVRGHFQKKKTVKKNL